MEIQREEHRGKGAFFIDQDGEWIAELTYVRSGGDLIVIDHTEVEPAHRGDDLGKNLVAAAVEFARENGLKIRPDCPYAREVIEGNPDSQEVLASE